MGVDRDKLQDLLGQAIETEHGGIRIYETALRCARDEKLRKEWESYLDQTRRHEQMLREVAARAGMDADAETAARNAVRMIGDGLVSTMESTAQEADADSAQLVAAQCVVHAETKDHMNWSLLRVVAQAMDGAEEAQLLRVACDAVEAQEDEHLYHTRGWVRELTLAGLGLPAVLPPPEERLQVTTAIGAARAEQARVTMLDPQDREPGGQRT